MSRRRCPNRCTPPTWLPPIDQTYGRCGLCKGTGFVNGGHDGPGARSSPAASKRGRNHGRKRAQ